MSVERVARSASDLQAWLEVVTMIQEHGESEFRTLHWSRKGIMRPVVETFGPGTCTCRAISCLNVRDYIAGVKILGGWAMEIPWERAVIGTERDKTLPRWFLRETGLLLHATNARDLYGVMT